MVYIIIVNMYMLFKEKTMQITATNFRKDMFQILERAKQGEEVLVLHKGEQFRLMPEKPVDKLSRIQPVEVFHPHSEAADEERMKKEMAAEWEAKWEKRL